MAYQGQRKISGSCTHPGNDKVRKRNGDVVDKNALTVIAVYNDLDLLRPQYNNFNTNLLTFIYELLYLIGFRFYEEIGMFMQYPD